MSHELRNFEEGFREGKIAGIQLSIDQLLQTRWDDKSLRTYIYHLELCMQELKR